MRQSNTARVIILVKGEWLYENMIDLIMPDLIHLVILSEKGFLFNHKFLYLLTILRFNIK